MRFHAKNLEEVRRHQPAAGTTRFAAAENAECPVAELDKLIDGFRLLSVIRNFGKGEVDIVGACRNRRLTQMHESLCVRIWQMPEQNAVDDTEDGGVGTDTESQGQDECQGEARRFPKVPDGNFQLSHVLKPSLPS